MWSYKNYARCLYQYQNVFTSCFLKLYVLNILPVRSFLPVGIKIVHHFSSVRKSHSEESKLMSSEFQIVMTVACCQFRDFTPQEKYFMWLWCEYASDNVATNCITRKKVSWFVKSACKISNRMGTLVLDPVFFQVYMLLEKLSLKEFQGCTSLNWLICAILSCLLSWYIECGVCQHNWVWRHFKRYIFSSSKFQFTSKTFSHEIRIAAKGGIMQTYILLHWIWGTLVVKLNNFGGPTQTGQKKLPQNEN